MSNISLTSSKTMNLHSITTWMSNHLFEIFLTIYGIWVIIPWFAPVIMKLGWTPAGDTVYFIYSFFCHQLPQRSFFLFGEQSMYPLSQIQAVWQNTSDPMILRQFVGNSTMGWKVAWSDRMISFYTSIWFFALLFTITHRKIKPLSLIGFIILLIPMALDGGTHMLSDFSGIGNGFRDTNEWLVIITNNSFSSSFYTGDALGSFNSWMRFITGTLAGISIAWYLLPRMFEIQTLTKQLPELNIDKVFEQNKS
jgi:uncharacterized membrane protein